MRALTRQLRSIVAAVARSSRDVLYLFGLVSVAVGMATFHPGLGWVALGLGLLWAAGAGVRRR